jgi:hypothetical protein
LEVRAMIDTVIEPNGCRHCGEGRRMHFSRYAEGVGYHQWTEPTNEQRLARMHLRRAPTCPCLTWAGDIRVPRPNGHHPLCDGTGQHRRIVLDHPHDIDAGGNCRDPRCSYNSDEAYEQAVSDYVRGDGPNPHGEVPILSTENHVLLQIGTRDTEGMRTFEPPGDVCAACSDPTTGRWVPVSQCPPAMADAEAYYATVNGEGLPACTEPRHAHTLNAALETDADPDEDPVTWRHCADCHADDYDHGTDRGGPYCGHTAGCPNC